MTEPTVPPAEVIAFVEAVGKKNIKFDWQRNFNAYYQYLVEVQMLGIFTPEAWFADAGRRQDGFPQAIERDYLDYQQSLAEATQTKQEKQGVAESLEALKAQVAELQAKLAKLNLPAASGEGEPAPTQET